MTLVSVNKDALCRQTQVADRKNSRKQFISSASQQKFAKTATGSAAR